MSARADPLRQALGLGPRSARELAVELDVSQPTVSRVITALGDAIVRIGAARSIQYGLRDTTRGFGDIPVYRISAEGRIRRLGVLIPVRPEGFVMRQKDGVSSWSAGLPWWLADMCPQGFLGRVFAQHHGAALGLPESLSEWSESDCLRALLVRGDNVVGNLVLGDAMRDRFVEAPAPVPIGEAQYAALAASAESGELPGSSAGGEQPKFTAFNGRHVLVKFSAAGDNPVITRWRDLLACEHLALETLREAGIAAVPSRLIDRDGRRFLEIERFDRCGELGRRASHSLTALDAEFVGKARAPWPELAAELAAMRIITTQAAAGAELLYAFGALIGNTDMHTGNLSFIAEHGRPYDLAPTYDMLPMAFAPRSGGALPARLPAARLLASVAPETWRRALTLAEAYLDRMKADTLLSDDWSACAEALARHVDDARTRIRRLG